MAACRSCGKSITFAVTTSGKSAPFEVDADGEWALDDRGVMQHAGKASSQLEIGTPAPAARYTSHFARCKDANAWRKR